MTDKSKPITLVVRRGALRRFDRLKSATRELPADVIWDRRGQRPGVDVTVDEPAKNRRKATPPTWELADFVVTENQAPRRSSRARSKKS